MTKVAVDADACVCSGACVRAAPRIFELPAGAPAAVVRLVTIDDPELIAQAEEAADNCPTSAISLD